MSKFSRLKVSQEWLGSTDLKVVKACHSTLIPRVVSAQRPLVDIWGKVVSDVVTTWKPANLVKCHSSWCCPACTPVKMAQYQRKIQGFIDKAYLKRLYPMLVTFTISHDFGQSLPDLFKVLQKSWNIFSQSKIFKDYKELVSPVWEGKPYLPIVRAGEISLKIAYNEFNKDYGKLADDLSKEIYYSQLSNPRYSGELAVWQSTAERLGSERAMAKMVADITPYTSWHYHNHCLWFVRKDSYAAYKAGIPALQELWADSVIKSARKVLNVDISSKRADLIAHGLDFGLKPSHDSSYLFKVEGSSWGADAELTCSTKKGRKGNLNPFDLLDVDTPLHRAVWKAYCVGTKGQQRVITTKGISQFFKGAKVEQDNQSQCLFGLDLSVWNKIVDRDLTDEFGTAIKGSVLSLKQRVDDFLVEQDLFHFGINLYKSYSSDSVVNRIVVSELCSVNLPVLVESQSDISYSQFPLIPDISYCYKEKMILSESPLRFQGSWYYLCTFSSNSFNQRSFSSYFSCFRGRKTLIFCRAGVNFP